jgi:gamma-glutamyl-gamma-aminobutyrate hydrolase PuuD
MDRLIYVENDYDGRYGKFWGELGFVIRDRDLYLHRPQDFGLVCFTGGEDVSPELYSHKNLGSHNSPRRDADEQNVYDVAAKWKTPMTGICRGSQFLNVQMHGTMVQNINAGHGGSPHNMLTVAADDDVRDMKVTSSHHQMSVLGEGGILLGHSEISVPWDACAYDGEFPAGAQCLLESQHVEVAVDGLTRVEIPTEKRIYMTEAFAYPDANIFAVQHHPEWQDINEVAPQWTLNMIRTHCFEEQTTTS